MNRMKKRILTGFLIVFLVMQFFRPEANSTSAPQPNAISAGYAVPETAAIILKKACNDCHSNNTSYPWYAHIQPVGWWLADHIKDGKNELNFDEFLTYGLKKQDHKLEELIEEVKKGHMPLPSYVRMHKSAALTKAEKEAIVAWADKTRKEIQNKMLVAGERKTP